jgi:hypothetical protein
VAASQRELALWPANRRDDGRRLGGHGILYGIGRWRGRWIRRRFPKAGA